ncbi:MAG: YdiU family protein [Pseudomonadota bacterium]
MTLPTPAAALERAVDATPDGAGPVPHFSFDNSYSRLPEHFYTRLDPTPVPDPKLVRLNHALAEALGLDPEALDSPGGAAVFAGNAIPEGAAPLAMVYAGYQFGGWSPQLGDGRAILLGEVIGRDGVRRDIQLKGSGKTPYSRMGDGRAVLGPVLREYIVSEAMAALGVKTTRALAAVTTGQQVLREGLLPGAVFTRVAMGHARVGTFQFFASRDDVEALKTLADYVIDRHYPAARESDAPYLALLEAVMDAQVDLVSHWMAIGFIHGVMNTDNMAISGETIDYGPCAFMDIYHPETVFSSIDHMGRYAYSNQPGIAHWNLACFAQCLIPLLDANEDAAIEQAKALLDSYSERFNATLSQRLRAKVGLKNDEDGDLALIQALLQHMAEGKADFTLTFRALSGLLRDADEQADAALRALFDDPSAINTWLADWRVRLGRETRSDANRQAAMRTVNPAVIPRNHLVEEAIAAGYTGDLAPFEVLLEALATPYEDVPENRRRYTLPPKPHEVVEATFCGT